MEGFDVNVGTSNDAPQGLAWALGDEVQDPLPMLGWQGRVGTASRSLHENREASGGSWTYPRAFPHVTPQVGRIGPEGPDS